MPIDRDQLFRELRGRIEDRTFDLKRQPPPVNEVVKEIQGGLNGVEPRYRVIIGVDEGVEKRFDPANVTPVTWPAGKGALVDADTYRSAIDAALKASTTDYHEGYWFFEEISVNEGHIVVVNVLKSPYGPHQNTQDGRYYIRRSGSTSHMTATEIREAMGASIEQRPDPDAPRSPVPEGELLADLRYHQWVSNADELRYRGGPQCHLRVLPLELKAGRFSPTYLKNNVREFAPPGRWRNASSERVEDGYLAWRVEAADHEVTGAFSKIFDTGEIWGVDDAVLASYAGAPANIPGDLIIDTVRNALQNYAGVLQNSMGISGPYRVQVTLHGVKGAVLHISSRRGEGRHLKDVFNLNSVWDQKADPDGSALCEEFARQLWDACGLVRPL